MLFRTAYYHGQQRQALVRIQDESEEMTMHRLFSGILGLVLVVAGLAASDYIPTTFKGYTLLSGGAAVFVPGVLMLSAFYMAFGFLKFAVTGKKRQTVD